MLLSAFNLKGRMYWYSSIRWVVEICPQIAKETAKGSIWNDINWIPFLPMQWHNLYFTILADVSSYHRWKSIFSSSNSIKFTFQAKIFTSKWIDHLECGPSGCSPGSTEYNTVISQLSFNILHCVHSSCGDVPWLLVTLRHPSRW